MSNVTSALDKLIANISATTISDFFKHKSSAFKSVKEEFKLDKKEQITFESLLKVGEIAFNDSDELLVFCCKAKHRLTERSSKKQQFEIARKALKEDFKDGAIFIFYDEEGNFRFSFIRKNYGNKEHKFSNWKRYTYYVELDKQNKTFKNRIDTCIFTDLDKIQQAFSVEKLTKEFYTDLFKWYQWTLSEEVGITFPNNTEITEDDRVKLEEQIIRLITRLLFVWFIKQKQLVPDELFEQKHLLKALKNFEPYSKEVGNYYNAILQNLFFATLNKAVNEREFTKIVDDRDIKTRFRYPEMFNISEDEVLELFRPVPFLNGGLFECLDKTKKMDGVKYALDGFSRNAEKTKGNFKHRAFIPNCVFFDEEKGIIPLFEKYNFTVEENAPNEVQVALDPELLGNVFENLLGAFNNETKETARKQSGSFYTPREIVSYMVDESLISYLTNAFPKLQEDLFRNLFETEDLPKELADNHAFCEEISNKLREVKILDPACGSGAFPMGILNRMVEVLVRLDCKEEKTIRELKVHLIQECIYGIDIQTIAAQISKLRFFISLIVEQEAMDFSRPDENYGVDTLPNLETKFVAANTLIGMKRKQAQGNLFENPLIEITKQELLAIRKEHFYAKTANSKKRLREKDAELRDKLSRLLQENGDFAPDDAIQFSKWNPYDQNESSPFFDPEWMFGLSKENGGLNSQDGGYFDIVIANPPYINVEKLEQKTKKYLFENYETCSGRTDIYVAFIEKSLQVLKHNGKFSFIIPYPFTNQNYGALSRKMLVEKYYIKEILDTSEYYVFETAVVKNIILSVLKSKKNYETIIKSANSKEDFNNNSFAKFSLKQQMFLELKNNRFETKNIKDALLVRSKLLNKSIRLDEICLIAYGARLNHKTEDLGKDYFIHREYLKGYKPFTEGKNIERYHFNQNGWLDYQPLEHYNSMFPELFENEKIFFINIVKDKLRFAFDHQNFYNSHTVINCIKWNLLINAKHITVKRNITDVKIENAEKFSYKYLLAILNSNLINWYFLNFLSESLHFYPDDAKELPIPNVINYDTQEKVISIVDNIIEGKGKGQDTKSLEIIIDKLVYKLYSLSYDEVKIIEPLFLLSKEEYDDIKV